MIKIEVTKYHSSGMVVAMILQKYKVRIFAWFHGGWMIIVVLCDGCGDVIVRKMIML